MLSPNVALEQRHGSLQIPAPEVGGRGERAEFGQ